jgi:hypothetical protein
MVDTKVMKLDNNASINLLGLSELIESILSDLNRYDFTKPIEKDKDNIAIKKIVADSRKRFKEINDEKIALKKAILEPYDKVDSIIKDFKKDFDEKIEVAETNRKQYEEDKRKEFEKSIIAYFDEVNKHSLLTFDKLKLNVINSGSEAQYKKDIDNKLKVVDNDLKVIESDENANRIRVEYFKDLDLSRAIIAVKTDIENELSMSEIAKRDDVVPQTIKDEQSKEVNKYVARFECSEEQLVSIKKFFADNGIEMKTRQDLS